MCVRDTFDIIKVYEAADVGVHSNFLGGDAKDVIFEQFAMVEVASIEIIQIHRNEHPVVTLFMHY